MTSPSDFEFDKACHAGTGFMVQEIGPADPALMEPVLMRSRSDMRAIEGLIVAAQRGIISFSFLHKRILGPDAFNQFKLASANQPGMIPYETMEIQPIDPISTAPIISVKLPFDTINAKPPSAKILSSRSFGDRYIAEVKGRIKQSKRLAGKRSLSSR